MDCDLVFDIGMNDGDDTAYYLSRAHRVVAVEADSRLVIRARERFSAIPPERLTIVDAALADRPGLVDFWINEEKSYFNSLQASVAGCNGMRTHKTVVESITLPDLFQQFGVPYYLKCDIEGGDIHCVRGLSAVVDPPQYLSVEATSLELLMLMWRAGYTKFKIVDQLAHNYRLKWNNETLLGRIKGSFQHCCISLDRRVLKTPRAHSRTSSGPFGEESPGDWLTFEDVAYEWLHREKGYANRGHLNPRSWWDFHAKLEN